MIEVFFFLHHQRVLYASRCGGVYEMKRALTMMFERYEDYFMDG